MADDQKEGNEKKSGIFLKDLIYLFLERGEGGEKVRKSNTHVRETWIGCLLYLP